MIDVVDNIEFNKRIGYNMWLALDAKRGQQTESPYGERYKVEWLADKIGVNSRTLYRYLAGEKRPNLIHFAAIAKALDVTTDSLLM